MVITTTAVGFILLASGVAFCGWRFLVAFQRVSNPHGRSGAVLIAFFFMSALQNGILGLGALFFPNSPNGLYSSILLSHLFLSLLAIISTYMTFYILFPGKKMALPILAIGMLGAAFVLLTITLHPQPTLTFQNGIDWGVNSPLSLLMFFLFFVSLAPPTYIFYQLFRSTASKELKQTSLIIATLCGGGIVNVFMRLVILRGSFMVLRTQLLDMGVAIIGVGFIIISVIPSFFRYSSPSEHIPQKERPRIYDF